MYSCTAITVGVCEAPIVSPATIVASKVGTDPGWEATSSTKGVAAISVTTTTTFLPIRSAKYPPRNVPIATPPRKNDSASPAASTDSPAAR